MELTEEIKIINERLKEDFGVDSFTGIPIWRVVFSEDQFEHRYGTYDDITPAGIYLRTVTETRYVPKYRQWIHKKYILERLVVIPEHQQKELPASPVSYEPIWVFEDKHGNYLPPKWEPIKLIIDSIYAVQYSNHNLARYKDPISSREEELEDRVKRIDQIEQELFGDESGLSGASFDESGSAIFVPHNYEKVKH